MKIIIVGGGKVGVTLVEQLSREGHNITLIDMDGDKLQRIANTFDVMGVTGNGASYSTQMEAGVETADLLIAVTGSDELNLLCCLFAKKAGNCQTIARVRNPVYNKEVRYIQEELGLSMVINPEFAASMEIARILKFPSAIRIDTFAKGKVELLKFKIYPEYHLDQMRITDIRGKFRCDILICAVERGEDVMIPSGNFILREGDIVSIVAPPRQSADFFHRIGIANNRIKNALIVGGGKISYYLSKQLEAMGISVKIIEMDRGRCEELSELLPKATIIYGDGTDQSILLEEGIRQADAFVALTNLDEENILLALYAKSQSKAKLITKVNRISFDQIIDQLDIDSIIYPKYITASYIIQYVRAMQNSIGSNVETLYRIIENRAEALEFCVHENSPVVGIPLEKLDLKENLLICCINRDQRVIIPKGQDTIEVGDTVIVVTTNTGLNDLKDILKH